MAVEDFAPAVLALSDLIKRANVLLNGEKDGAVKVLIDVDVEQHCFEFDIQIVHSIWEKAKGLFGDAHIKSAADIGHAIGVIAGGAAGVVGLIGALKKLRGRAPAESKVVMRDGNSVVEIKAGGDVFYVAQDAAKLLTDATSIKSAKTAISPAGQPGYDKVEFEEKGGATQTIDNEEARLIQSMPVPTRPEETVIPPSRMRAQVGIRRAVYIGPGKWTIQHEKAREMTIADEDWLRRFQSHEIDVPPGSLLDVTIGVSAIKLDSHGEAVEPPEYTIVTVHSVILPRAALS